VKQSSFPYQAKSSLFIGKNKKVTRRLGEWLAMGEVPVVGTLANLV
jgi:hypothetical protein